MLDELSTPTPMSSHLLASKVPGAMALLPNLAHVSGSATGTLAYDAEKGRETLLKNKTPLLHVRRPHSQGPILITV